MHTYRRAATVGGVLAALTVLAAGPAAAHSQTVAPPGQDAPVREGVAVSNSWAQAHCHAESPAVLADIDGVATFAPGGALPCGDAADTHPGGRTHPHAGS